MIPTDWNVSDPSTWKLTTTVNAHMGYHKTGAVMRQHQTITVSALDSGWWVDDLDTNPLDEVCAEWWYDNVIEPDFDHKVAYAEASPEEKRRAAIALDCPDGDIWMYFTGYDDAEQEGALNRTLTAALIAAKEETQ